MRILTKSILTFIECEDRSELEQTKNQGELNRCLLKAPKRQMIMALKFLAEEN